MPKKSKRRRKNKFRFGDPYYLPGYTLDSTGEDKLQAQEYRAAEYYETGLIRTRSAEGKLWEVVILKAMKDYLEGYKCKKEDLEDFFFGDHERFLNMLSFVSDNPTCAANAIRKFLLKPNAKNMLTKRWLKR